MLLIVNILQLFIWRMLLPLQRFTLTLLQLKQILHTATYALGSITYYRGDNETSGTVPRFCHGLQSNSQNQRGVSSRSSID